MSTPIIVVNSGETSATESATESQETIQETIQEAVQEAVTEQVETVSEIAQLRVSVDALTTAVGTLITEVQTNNNQQNAAISRLESLTEMLTEETMTTDEPEVVVTEIEIPAETTEETTNKPNVFQRLFL